MITMSRLFAASFLLVWLCLFSGCGADQNLFEFDHRHAVYDTLLATHVSGGLVDYRGLLSEREVLREYVTGLARVGETEYNEFSDNEQLAFLINAYNAYTLELILQNYPVESITGIPGAWDEKRWALLGESVTLNELEHELIRKQFNEPRIHAALVCAARGCPPLKDEAYTAERLQGQLEAVTRDFVTDSTRNRLDMTQGLLEISKIFEWYGNDFVSQWGQAEVPEGSPTSPVHRAMVGLFREYLLPNQTLYLRTNPVRIEYLDYDWSLNEQDR